MAELGKKIDEQALTALTKTIDSELAQKSSITGYNKLKSTQQALVDLFAEETYASHDTKEGLQKTRDALQKVISEREKKGGKMPQYVAAMKTDMETIDFRLAHLDKLHDETKFEVNNNGEIAVDTIFLKNSDDIVRTGIEMKSEGITLGGKEVKVVSVDKKTGDISCMVDGTTFIISHAGEVISVKPSSVLTHGSLEITLLGVYGKEAGGKTTKRVGQEKKVLIDASADDKKAFVEKENSETLKAITDIDAVQNISGKTIDSFENDSATMFAMINDVFSTNENTKLYRKYLDDAQKKLFIDDMIRSNPLFSISNLVKKDEAKDVFFAGIIDYKNTGTTSKSTSDVTDAFVGFHKNLDIQKAVTEALQTMLKKNIITATDDAVKNKLAEFYKKYSTKKVSEFDLFYNKLENDQTGAFDKIKEAFETVKQGTMIEAFTDAMGANSHVQSEKIGEEGVWENIPGDQQKRFSMQMVFQDPKNVTYPTWNRIQYMPALHADTILSLESFLESFKDEIAALAKQETDPAKLRGAIKTLIIGKLTDSEVKDILKKKLRNTFDDKISQNISGGNTNILNEMNKFAIDAKAFQPGYKKYVDQNPTSNPTAVDTQSTAETIDVPTDFDISEFDESKELTMNATISDVKRVYEDQAEHAGEEDLRKQYEALGKFNLLKGNTYSTFGKRMKLYFFRETIKNKTKKAELQKYQTNGVDMHRSELTAAADRHERMYAEWNNQENEKDRIDRVLEQVNDPQVDDLCKEYLNASVPMEDRAFEDRFNTIIANNPTISKALSAEKIKHSASNILLKLRTERSYKTMMSGLLLALEQYAGNSDANTYEATVKQHITTYVNATQRAISPNLQKALTAPGAQVESYRRWMRHEIGMAKMQANTLKIKLDVLTKGKGAYEINNRDKKTNVFARIGRRLDNNPKTALAISIGSTLAVGFFNPLWAGYFAATKGAAWMISKKAAHYTKEQEGQEKKLVRGLDGEKNRLTNLTNTVNNAGFIGKYGIGTKEYKAVRQGQLYANTTQYTFMNDAKKDIETLKTSMVALDKTTLRSSVADALARLDYYASSGHNFLGQQDDKNMEETINDLQKLTFAGAETLGVSVAEMRSNGQYMQTLGNLDTNYTNLRKGFKKQRGILIAKYGIAAVVMTAGLRSLASDVNHNSASSGSGAGTSPVPGHTPDPITAPTTPGHIAPTPIQDAQAAIRAPGFDADHHNFHFNEAPGSSIDGSGMSAKALYEHLSHVNVLEEKISKNITEHMIATQELLPQDKINVLSAVEKLAHGQSLPPSDYLQDKVAKYLYHFAERDAYLSQVIDGGGDAVKDVIKKTVIDGGSGQKGFLDAFLAGGETFARYLMNIASVSSPLFANTFIEKVAITDKNGKNPGSVGYIPTYNPTIVDPNKKPVPGGFTDENALDWIVRKGDNTQPVVNQGGNNNVSPTVVTPTGGTNNPGGVNPTNNIPPTLDPNQNGPVVLVPPTVDTQAQIQAELEKAKAEQFLIGLTGSLETLTNKYSGPNGYVEMYNDITSEFEQSKTEPDINTKIKTLESLKNRVIILQQSLQSLKEVADKTFDDFKNRYDILPQSAQEKVKPTLAELQTLRRNTQTTIRELGTFINTLTQVIVDAGAPVVTSQATAAQVQPPVNASQNPVVKQPIAAPINKIAKAANNNPQPKKVVKQTTPVANTIVKQQPIQAKQPVNIKKVENELKKIKIPATTLPDKQYISEIKAQHDIYFDVVRELEERQKDVRLFLRDMLDRKKSGKVVNQNDIDTYLAEKKYHADRIDMLEESYSKFLEETISHINAKKEMASISHASNLLLDRYNKLADTDNQMTEDYKVLSQKSIKASTKPVGNNIKTSPAKGTGSSKNTASGTVKKASSNAGNTPAPVATNNSGNTPVIQQTVVNINTPNAVPAAPVIIPPVSNNNASGTSTAPTTVTTVNTPQTIDSLLAEMRLGKGKHIHFIKKNNKDLFAEVQKLVRDNKDKFNISDNKNQIAINGILDTTVEPNVWVGTAPTK